jgi:riboflavin biosynthesis pyrimidine reductase
MKVKTQHKIFDSDKEPIMLTLNDRDKERIRTLKTTQHTYLVFPYQMKLDTAHTKLKILIPKKQK